MEEIPRPGRGIQPQLPNSPFAIYLTGAFSGQAGEFSPSQRNARFARLTLISVSLRIFGRRSNPRRADAADQADSTPSNFVVCHVNTKKGTWSPWKQLGEKAGRSLPRRRHARRASVGQREK